MDGGHPCPPLRKIIQLDGRVKEGAVMGLKTLVKYGIKALMPYGIIVFFRKLPSRVIKQRLKVANNKETAISENKFDNIYQTNAWGDGESRSGSGSYAAFTKQIRKALPKLWKKYDIKTFLDAPCGDFNWMRLVDKTGIEYIGCDIVGSVVEDNIRQYSAQNISFINLDITKDDLPKVNMILCKDCLQHLSYENAQKALDNFKRSGSKYLLVTSYPLTYKNWDIKDGEYRPLNLCIEPFNLGAPLEKIKEGALGGDVDRTEYLFKL